MGILYIKIMIIIPCLTSDQVMVMIKTPPPGLSPDVLRKSVLNPGYRMFAIANPANHGFALPQSYVLSNLYYRGRSVKIH